MGYGKLGCKESDTTEHLSPREYYKQLYASKFNNLDKINKLLERQTTMLLQEEIDNLNCLILVKQLKI